MNLPTKTQTANAPVTLRGLIQTENFRRSIAKVLPKYLTAERFILLACNQLTKVPKLALCTQESFVNCLVQLSQMGLEPNGYHAHLIPFENRRTGKIECTLIVDYKGYVELVMRSGKYSRIHADVVRENDIFEYDIGQIVRHKIDFSKPRGKLICVYALVQPNDGTAPKCEIMDMEMIEGIRKRSKAPNAGPWVTDYEEMVKKTVFKRLRKWLQIAPAETEDMSSDDETPVTVDEIALPAIADAPAPAPEPIQPEPTAPPRAPEPASELADAGLAPEAEAPAAPPPPPPPAAANFDADIDYQDLLANIVTGDAQSNWDTFADWCVQSGNLENAKDLTGFVDVPRNVAKRLVNARTGLIRQLKGMKT